MHFRNIHDTNRIRAVLFGKGGVMMSKPKVGDLKWSQLSMWESAPKDCIEKYERSLDGSHIFHFVLHRTVEVFSDTHTRFDVPTDLAEIPKEFFKDGADYYVRKDYKSTKIEGLKNE